MASTSLHITVEPSAIARIAELTHCLAGLRYIFTDPVEHRELVDRLSRRLQTHGLRFVVNGSSSDLTLDLASDEFESYLMSEIAKKTGGAMPI